MSGAAAAARGEGLNLLAATCPQRSAPTASPPPKKTPTTHIHTHHTPTLSCDDTLAAKASGKLKAMLQEAGVSAKL